MTVHPGFGGQSFRPEMMEKVKARANGKRKPALSSTSKSMAALTPTPRDLSIQNGANVLVAGTSIFHSKDYAEAIRELRGIK